MVIIGQTTVVRVPFATDGIQSVNWTVGTNPNRLYTLGSTAVFATIIPAQNTFNVTVYGGNSTAQSFATGCAAGMSVSVVPGYCPNGPIQPVPFSSNTAVLTSYSYNKDYMGNGTETWNLTAFMKYPGNLGTKVYADDVPDTFAIGMMEGTLQGDGDYTTLGNIAGANMVAGAIIAGYTGNVQATAQSIGTYEQTWYGTFDKVGGSQFVHPGIKASANVTISQSPIYNGDT